MDAQTCMSKPEIPENANERVFFGTEMPKMSKKKYAQSALKGNLTSFFFCYNLWPAVLNPAVMQYEFH